MALTSIACMLAILPAQPGPPQPYGPVPSPRQLRWHDLEFYGFLHFSMNTFTDREWGYGDEPPATFHPTDFSAEQIVAVARAAGMRGLILTCKHHDGFCLWPSSVTSHSVASSGWRSGGGDVVREVADACRRNDLAFGVYLSPWDRNHREYGRPAYVDAFQAQLTELLREYGPIFEVWFDGANGGDGFYGGAREARHIDRSRYYGWEETWDLVRRLAPDAVIFSDAGPDVRWVGNEHGEAGDPCWATYTPRSSVTDAPPAPGQTEYREGFHGHRDGGRWMPAEVDVSIRPGWFHHASQDAQVRSPHNLLDLYYQSVGRGASLLLNLPPDRRGRIHERDEASLREFRRMLDATFADNLAARAVLRPSNVRGGSNHFGPRLLLDGERGTHWCTDDAVTRAELELEFDAATTFNVLDLREALHLGQRVHGWGFDAWREGAWVELARGESIGSRRLWRGDPVSARRIRLRLEGPVCPALAELGLYLEPEWVRRPPQAP